MDNLDLIKEFFSNLKCSQCQAYFNESSIKVMRQEGNYTVVRVTCPKCEKQIGMALMGFEKEGSKISGTEAKCNLPFEIDESSEPITYDDVIDAHNFFQNLDEDWIKHLPKNSQ